jgi:PAS domain S-box-containing protein
MAPDELGEEFFAALDVVPSGVLVADADGTIVRVNASLEQIFGYDRGELLGRKVEELLPERVRAHHAVLRGGFTANPQAKLMGQGRDLVGLRKDGTEVPIEVGLGPLHLDRGVFVVANVAEITERRGVDREALSTRVFDQSPVGMAILDKSLRYVHVNPALTRLLGYAPNELLGKTPRDITPPGEHAEDERLAGLLSRGELSAYFRTKHYVRKDGSLLDVQVSAAPVKDGLGNVSGYLGQVYDLTEAKAQERALEHERSRFRALVEAAPIGIFEIDRDGRVTFMNSIWAELTGLSREDAASIEMREKGIHPDDRQRVLSVFAEAGRCGRAYSFEFRYTPPGGKMRRLSTSATPVRDSAGQVAGFIGVTDDVTLRAETAEATERSLREKETLIKEIHHRVKNNLQIVGSIVSLQAKGVEDERLRPMFDDLRDRIHAIALLHERLYRSPDLADIDLDAYLGGLVTDAAQAAGIDANRARVTSAGPPIRLDMDRAVPVGLLVNELVTNAFKHGRRGPAPPSVEVVIEGMREGARITVIDDGPGFPGGVTPTEGASLGLFLVRSLARQLRARTTFASGPTRCVVEFPLDLPAEKRGQA